MWGGGLEQAVVTADPSPYLFLCDVCEAVLEKNLGSGYKWIQATGPLGSSNTNILSVCPWDDRKVMI